MNSERKYKKNQEFRRQKKKLETTVLKSVEWCRTTKFAAQILPNKIEKAGELERRAKKKSQEE
jgi:hypothetical protein